MRQSKTTLKELTAAYRAVLRYGILCNAIALGLFVAPASADYTNVSLDALYPSGTASSFKYDGNQNVTWLAENISVTEPGDGRAIEIGLNAAYSATEPTMLHLGGENTDSVTINTAGDGILVRTKSLVEVYANDTISITSTVDDPDYDGGFGYGALWVQNSSNPGQTDAYATANLTADQINLTNLNASAIAALSEGCVNINGNATIKGKDAIYASGLSETNINAAGDKTVKMEGDIDFRQGPSSSTPVDATVNVTLNGDESYWTGNTVLSYLNKPSDDKLQINHGATITMQNGATWTATEIAGESAEPGVATNGRYYTALKNLNVNNGNVVVNRANGIEVENLTTNGLNITGGNMTVSKSLTATGAHTTVGAGAGLTVDATEGAVFDGSSTDEQGGAIYNYGALDIDGATFTGNRSTSMTWLSQGGAIFNSGDDDYLEVPSVTANISNTTFGDKNDALKGNQALNGGAIYNESSLIDGEVTLNNVNFYNNKAFADTDGSDGYTSSLGGAILNQGIITVNDDTEFADNIAEGSAVKGGAISNQDTGTITFNDGVTFDSNIANKTIQGNGAQGGAIDNEGIIVFKKLATFVDNEAVNEIAGPSANRTYLAKGGAIYNESYGSPAAITFEKGAVFERNGADLGGAIFNEDGTLTLNDATFIDNTANRNGGAVYNADIININAVDSDVVFSGNKANGQVEDIYNTGTVNFNAASGRNINVEGIQGPGGNINKTGVGTLSVSEYIANQTVNVDAGELHLTTGEANLYRSQVFVSDGATINTIDDEINDYMSGEGNNGIVTLADGANIKGDLDYIAGVADTYAAEDGANINYKLANALGADVQYGAQKEIQITNAGATINDGTFAWYADSDHGLSVESGGAGTGTILVTGQSGGINSAVDVTDSSEQDIEYTLTAATETFDGNGGTDNVIEKANFAITGNGNDENNSHKLVLANDLVVGEESTLALESVVLKHDDTSETVEKIDNQSTLNVHNSTLDVNLSNSGTATVSGSRLAAGKLVENKVGATMTILNSQVDADFNNAGIMYSDPTTYTATVSNTGTANFDDDTFTGTAVLANSGTANLTNGVTFENGASIQGTGTTNLVNGTTHFNNTESTNIVKLASGAEFDGTLVNSGMVDTRNDNIDNVTGSVSGGDLHVDANLTGNGAIDTFASSNGATIKQINLTESSYGTAKSYSLNAGGADVDANVKVTGATNYYTKVDANGGNVVFSDKLMNTSGMHEQIGDWGDGNYISASTNYDTTTDSYSNTTGQTVGQALTLLDTEVANANNAIGSLSTLDTTNGVLDNNASVAANLQNLDTALNNVRTATAANDQLVLNQSVAYTDERVDRLDKELSSGIASAVALSSVAVSDVNRGEVSVGAGYGYYNGRSAAAFGAVMGLTNRWSVNAGAGVSDADVSFRAGTNYKFKLF